MEKLQLGNITVDVEIKDIKNIHLSVYPPVGRVRIAVPLRMDLDTIRVYVISKLNWIKKQQAKFSGQEREEPREFINRESHYFNGKRYLLKIVEEDSPAKVLLKHKTIELHIRSGTSVEKRQGIIDRWYRSYLKSRIPVIIQQWERRLNVQVAEFGVKRMKTKWGTCNREARRIWLNLELAKKPPECLEYIIVHEMMHLLERYHNDRFVTLMDDYLPKWRTYKEELNRLPVKHEEWNY